MDSPLSLSRPLRSTSSMMKAHSTTSAPSRLTRFAAAFAVPAVAIRSSMMRMRSPFVSASLWISILSVPYSRLYSSDSTSWGSFPGFLMGTNPQLSRYASGAPKINPLDSMPTTLSISLSL